MHPANNIQTVKEQATVSQECQFNSHKMNAQSYNLHHNQDSLTISKKHKQTLQKKQYIPDICKVEEPNNNYIIYYSDEEETINPRNQCIEKISTKRSQPLKEEQSLTAKIKMPYPKSKNQDFQNQLEKEIFASQQLILSSIKTQIGSKNKSNSNEQFDIIDDNYREEDIDFQFTRRHAKGSYKRLTNIQRKVRVTLTSERVDQLNLFFEEYTRAKDAGHVVQSMKHFGQKINMGYSTMIHKYRQFQNEGKVKLGVRGQTYIKRKYKKSYKIESIIQKALKEGSFYTAEEMSKFIHARYKTLISRSIIARHLTSMGFSFNNIKPHPIFKNQSKYKQIRHIFGLVVQNYINKQYELIFIDQIALSINLFKNHPNTLNFESTRQRRKMQKQQYYVSLFVVANSTRMYFYQLKNGFFTREDFCLLLRKLKDIINDQFLVDFGKHLILTDINAIHYDLNSIDDTNYSDKTIQNTLSQLQFERIFLPPHSPQLNPVESMLSDLKLNLLKRRETITDRQELWREMQTEIETNFSTVAHFYFSQLQDWISKAINQQLF